MIREQRHPSSTFSRLFCFLTYVEAQPIRGFSQRSRVSKSIFHFLVFWTPDCIAVRVGTKMRTLRVLMCSSGTPVIVEMSCRKTKESYLRSLLHGSRLYFNTVIICSGTFWLMKKVWKKIQQFILCKMQI